MADHPLRPPKPARPYPHAGEDNTDWHAWLHACEACRLYTPGIGCMKGGTIQRGGKWYALCTTAPGGCSAWHPREHTHA